MQGTYETFAAAAKQHFDSDLSGKLVVSAGLGGMGGAQPLSITMNNGIALIIEVDPARIQRRLDTNYIQHSTDSLNDPSSASIAIPLPTPGSVVPQKYSACTKFASL